MTLQEPIPRLIAPWFALCVTLAIAGHASADAYGDDGSYRSDAPIREVRGLTGFVQGELALRMREPERAVMAFRRTTQSHPDVALGWLKLAEALTLSGRLDEANHALDRAEQKDAVGWELALGRAQTAQAAHDISLALRVFYDGDWSSAPPSYFDAWSLLASQARDELAQRRAAVAYTRALPESPDGWLRLGNVLRAQGYIESAIEPLITAARLPGGSPQAAYEAILELITLERFDDAVDEANRCVARYTAFVGCYQARIRAILARDEHSANDAAPPGVVPAGLLADAESQAPSSSGAKAERRGRDRGTESDGEAASTAAARGDVESLDEAIRALARMTSATPRLFQATGRQLMGQTSAEVALRYADIVTELRPYNRNLREVAGWLAVSAGDEEAAIRFFEQLFALDDLNASALNYVGYTLAERGERLDDAERYVRKALLLSDGDPNIKDSLAWVLFKKGRHRDALRVQLEAIEALPTNAVILDHLGDIYHALGRLPAAREAWRKALDFATPDDEDVLQTVPGKLDER